MTVVSFVNQKGGCGKSTLAVHLAWWLASKNHKVAVIDSDGQQSASRWLEKLEPPIQTYVISDGEELGDQIPAIAEHFDYVVVDGGGMLSLITLNILLESDIAIIPAQPTGLDLSSTYDALKVAARVQQKRRGLPATRLVLNRATKGTRLLSESQALLKEKGLLNTVIHQRQVLADCFGQREVIWTMPGNTKEAADEFESFCKEVMGVIKNGQA